MPSRFTTEQRPTTIPSSESITWEEVLCPLCGGQKQNSLFEAADPTPQPHLSAQRFLVVQCQECQFQFVNPRPSPSDIGLFYPAEYVPYRQQRLKQRQRQFPFEQQLGQPGRLLDFGCGAGALLKRMRSLGWEVTGLDMHAPTVQRLRFEEDLTVHLGTLPHAALEPCSFDVITLWHSLEHVHEPLDLLQEVYQLLVPGGMVVVSVPNIESWPFRHFGADWFGLDVPRHLSHFTPSTLMQSLHLAGLRVQTIKTLRQADWLRSSAKRQRQAGRGGFLTKLMHWKPAAKFAAAALQHFKQSDCLFALAQRPH